MINKACKTYVEEKNMIGCKGSEIGSYEIKVLLEVKLVSESLGNLKTDYEVTETKREIDVEGNVVLLRIITLFENL